MKSRAPFSGMWSHPLSIWRLVAHATSKTKKGKGRFKIEHNHKSKVIMKHNYAYMFTCNSEHLSKITCTLMQCNASKDELMQRCLSTFIRISQLEMGMSGG